MPAGEYRASFRMRVAEGRRDGTVAELSVASAGGRVLGERTVRGADCPAGGAYGDFEVRFELPRPEVVELRTFFSDRADVWVDRVDLKCTGTP